MTSSVIDGTVEWTGDNPFIYLSKNGGQSWATLALMFRLSWSPFGSGNAVLVLEEPQSMSDRGDSIAFCASDNQEMAHDLVSRFVPNFAVFRSASALQLLEFVEARDFQCGGETGGSYAARCATDDYGPVALRWSRLRAPFAVAAPKAETATGDHMMLSVFQPADAAAVVVGDRVQEGTLVERDFFGGRSMSAGLAFSESWIRET